MQQDCLNRLTAGIEYDCSAQGRPKAGLETKGWIINRSDLDRAATVQSGATLTSIVLNSGATSFEIGWIKQLGTAGSEFTASDTGRNTFALKFAARVHGTTAEDIERVYELGSGEFIVILETKFKGANDASAFKCFGYEQGLVMASGTWASGENDGSFIFELASAEGFGESYPMLNVNLGTYAQTKAAIAALAA